MIASKKAFLQKAESKVEILINELFAKINKDICGHFVEHLGGVVYDGIRVGAGGRLVYEFAPASVTRLPITLA